MNLQNLSTNQLVGWAALLLGLFVAVALGSAVGKADLRMVAGAVALIPVVIVFVKLKTNIWVLLPVGWYLAGSLPWLPLPFTVRDLCFLTVIFFFTLFYATRALPWKRKIGTLDYLIYINLAYLVVVFVRNPVGFWALQTSMVGGRPYFAIALAFLSFAILSRVRLTNSLAGIFPLFFVIPAWIIAILDAVGLLFPQTAYALAMIYSGVGSTTSSLPGMLQEEARVGETRFSGMLNAGWVSVLALCARYNPISLISPLYPVRFVMFLVAFGAIFLSGFRSTLLFGFVAFFLSAVLRQRGKDLWIAGAAMVLAIIALISLQGSVLQLPRTMQRALSWLPGDWDQSTVAEAEASSRWRFEMWEWAWNDERILRDKVWGQGFGFSLDDMNLIASSLVAGEGGASRLGGSDRENFMITGAFHSGPLSTIKYIGIVGFVLYYPLMCYMAFFAWKLCRRAYGTKAFSLALFVGIPVMYEPFNFVVVFGGLDHNYPQLLFWAGLLNMTSNWLDRLGPAPGYESAGQSMGDTAAATTAQSAFRGYA